MFAVIKSKGKNTRKLFNHSLKITRFPVFFIKRNDNLAIRAGQKVIGISKLSTDFLMIVDFAVSSQDDFSVIAYKRLLSAERVNNRKTFMTQNRIISSINPAPVRTTVTNSLTHLQNLSTQFLFQALRNRSAATI